jgi:alkylation response protein AidB-like acyl-CoA dehydrogenase
MTTRGLPIGSSTPSNPHPKEKLVNAPLPTPPESQNSPVTPGSAALDELVAAIAASPTDSGRATRGPHAAIDLVRQSGFGAFRIPRAEGGGGASLREFFASLIDLAAANPDVPHILRAHFWFVEERLRATDPALRQRWLERVLAGEIIGNAMSEASGTAAVGSWAFQTTLTPDGESYRLEGEKFYCTGTLFSDWVNVFAVLPDGTLASACIPTKRAGVELLDDWDGVGQPYTGSGTARFHKVLVKADEVLVSAVDTADAAAEGQRGDPYLIGQFCQLVLTAVIAGILRNVATDAAKLLRSRSRTYTHGADATPASDPLLQQVVGEIASAAFAAEAVVLAAADAQDRAAASPEDFALAHQGSVAAAQAKVVADELALRAAGQLFDVGGSSAVKASQRLDRHWRNIRTLASHNPTIYKARAVGDWLVNGTELPNSGFF